MVMQIDLNDLESFPDHVKKILDTYGCIDILINNGGVGFRGSAVNTNMDVDIKIMTINYFAQVALTKGDDNFIFVICCVLYLFIFHNQIAIYLALVYLVQFSSVYILHVSGFTI